MDGDCRRHDTASEPLLPAQAGPASREGEVLRALSRIIDPDFGMDIVACGFVKDLAIDGGSRVAFRLELTTPACPIKDEFERKVGHRAVHSLSSRTHA